MQLSSQNYILYFINTIFLLNEFAKITKYSLKNSNYFNQKKNNFSFVCAYLGSRSWWFGVGPKCENFGIFLDYYVFYYFWWCTCFLSFLLFRSSTNCTNLTSPRANSKILLFLRMPFCYRLFYVFAINIFKKIKNFLL